MDLSSWFSYQLKACGEGFIWAVEQVLVERRDIAPPATFGEWSVSRHIFHLLYYERTLALPHMRHWLGEPLPSFEDRNQAMTYAIGDIHGEVTLLRQLLALLPFREEDTLVFLGDYMDRGEDSVATILALRELKRSHPNYAYKLWKMENIMNSTDTTTEPGTPENVEQDRIVMLSDGVFAIAITLLVFNIKVQDRVNVTDVWEIVYSLLPHFIGYTISFIVIASYWLGHRFAMKAITHVDRNFLWLNFIFLFFITIFPVPTDLLGEHFGVVAPTIIYACFSAATGLSLWLLWMYASGKARLLHPNFDPHEVRFRSTFYLVRSLIYLVSLFILFVPYGVYLFFAIWALLVPLLITVLRRVFLPRIRAKKAAG